MTYDVARMVEQRSTGVPINDIAAAHDCSVRTVYKYLSQAGFFKPGERQSDRLCSVDGCEKPAKARGLCGMHNERVRAHGTTALPDPRLRITKRVTIVESGCWIWHGRLDENGYPRLGGAWAHRVSYEVHIGPIPDGLHLDHLCRLPSCVNPGHLEPVTPRINMLRGESVSAIVVRANRCVRGHEFTEENTYWRLDGKGRQCRACSHLRHLAYRQRRAAA